MRLVFGLLYRSTLTVMLAIALTGCEQVGDVASGAGSVTKSLADKITGGGSGDADEEPAAAEQVVAQEQTNNQSASGLINLMEPDPDEEVDEEEEVDDVLFEILSRFLSLSLPFTGQLFVFLAKYDVIGRCYCKDYQLSSNR